MYNFNVYCIYVCTCKIKLTKERFKNIYFPKIFKHLLHLSQAILQKYIIHIAKVQKLHKTINILVYHKHKLLCKKLA